MRMRQSEFSARKLLTAAGATLVLGAALPAPAQDAAPAQDDQPSDFQFAADWFAWDWYATLGIGFRIGYYTADGHAAACAGGAGGAAGTCQSPKDLPESQVSLDQAQKTALTLLPLQVVATAEFTPFDRKW